MTKPIQIKNIMLGEGAPKICVPLTATGQEELMCQAENAVSAGADLVEWRADFYEKLDDLDETVRTLERISEILRSVPLLFTIRTKAEGGERELTLQNYENINLAISRSGKADLIDVEAFGQEEQKKALIMALQKSNVRVVASSHDFQKTGSREELLLRFQKMDAFGADILKIAVMPHSFSDVAAIMEVTSRMQEITEKPLISMSMGSLGVLSRIAGESFGSCLTFGTVGAASAPGQIPVPDLRTILETFHRQAPKDSGRNS